MTAEYPDNSHTAKDIEKAKSERPELKQITTSPVIERKESVFKRVAKTFTAEDSHSVGQYILFEVLIPATKSTISDMISQGVERLLFGGSTGSSPIRLNGSSNGRGNYTPYSSARPAPQQSRPAISQRGRETQNFREIILGSRAEAEQVIQALMDPLEQYDWVTVADLYKLVGVVPSFQDEKWGWDNLASATTRRVRDGYLLELPPTTYME